MKWLAALVAVPLVLAALLVGCRSEPSSSYRGTIVVGANYVQLLVTAPSDRACPPRIQRPGSCVRTPPTPNARCKSEPSCIQRMTVSAADHTTVVSDSSFAQVDWLESTAAAQLLVEFSGCGGSQSVRIPLGKAMPRFASANAKVRDRRVNLTWTPAAGADQVCALWRWPQGVEVCCSAEGGAASFPAPPNVTDVRLSRGRLLKTSGQLRVFRTRETANLLPSR